jgi:hypothetical protein
VAAIVSDDPKLLIKARAIYLSNQVIYSDTEEEKSYAQTNPFYSYMTQDCREQLLKLKQTGDTNTIASIDQQILRKTIGVGILK